MFDHLFTCLEISIIDIEHILYQAYKSITNHNILNDLNYIRNKTDHRINTFYKVILDIATEQGTFLLSVKIMILNE